ncbi:MAG: phosphatase PAP2 family protein [Woeseiaceae bacterium]|nr:phosphatase PAP2 family protein [Woeseiaceae bacterium]
MVDRQRRTLTIAALVALASLVLLASLDRVGDVDREITERFVDVSGTWLINHHGSSLRPWLYDGPKIAIALFGVGVLVLAYRPGLLSPGWLTRREALFVCACLAVVPLAIGVIKQHSNVQCPASLERYGGTQSNADAHLRITGFFETHRRGGCWPSGHTSGAFALLCLAWLERRRRVRLVLALPGLLAGVATGWYQVARGAHFASHILATALISIILISLLARAFGIGRVSSKSAG